MKKITNIFYFNLVYNFSIFLNWINGNVYLITISFVIMLLANAEISKKLYQMV